MPLYARLWTDILDDPKLLRAARKGLKNLDKLPWLIAFAKRADADGRLEISGEKADPADIARSIPNATERQVASGIASLLAIGILVLDHDDVPKFAAWEYRNAGKTSDSREAVAERVRKHRERKKETRNAGGNGGNALQALRGNEQESREKRVESKEKRVESKRSSTGRDSLPPTALEFGRTFYGAAPLDRQRDVRRQLLALLNGGVALRKGVRVTAGSIERLEAACRDVIRDGVKDPDKAIVVLITKLGDVSKESPTEKAAAADKREERNDGDRLAHATAWLETQPELAKEIDDLVAKGLPAGSMPSIVSIMRNAAIVKAWTDAGEPTPQHAETP